MRGHQLGVGDIGQMQGRSRIESQPSCGDDGEIKDRKHEPGMVSRWEWAQPHSPIQPCRDRRGVCDGSRQQDGCCVADGRGSDGAHWVREHQLGVGHIRPMQSRTRIGHQPSCGDDIGITGRKHEPGMVSGWEWAQSAASIEQGRDRFGVCDGAR